jgi:hypothetical protein
MHRGQPERGTIWGQCREAGRASSSAGTFAPDDAP